MVAKQVLRAASGWLELGMPDDALNELDGLDQADSHERKVLELKLSAEMSKEDWKAGSITAEILCKQAPDEPDFFLSRAFCLHETGNTAEALQCLEAGPEALVEFPVYHYNMACYHWSLDKKDQAQEFFQKAISLDDSFIEAAREDRDLAGMEIPSFQF